MYLFRALSPKKCLNIWDDEFLEIYEPGLGWPWLTTGPARLNDDFTIGAVTGPLNGHRSLWSRSFSKWSYPPFWSIMTIHCRDNMIITRPCALGMSDFAIESRQHWFQSFYTVFPLHTYFLIVPYLPEAWSLLCSVSFFGFWKHILLMPLQSPWYLLLPAAKQVQTLFLVLADFRVDIILKCDN